MSKVDIARQIAERVHADQQYGKGIPYTQHLTDVVSILREFGFSSDDYMCAAWLHDSLEDTNLSSSEVISEFGEDIFKLIDSVTNGKDGNRKQRAERSYILMYINRLAIALKLADRIANVRASKRSNDSKYEMYKKEYPYFKQRLYRYGEYDDMWSELDRLFV